MVHRNMFLNPFHRTVQWNYLRCSTDSVFSAAVDKHIFSRPQHNSLFTQAFLHSVLIFWAAQNLEVTLSLVKSNSFQIV
jgi:hypothetical protein